MRASIFVLFLPRPSRRARKETNMSPFCLIDIASIRDHDCAPHDSHDAIWHARFTAWIARLVHARQP
jgi:hypothetical protein